MKMRTAMEMEAEGTTDSNHYFKRWEESNREFNRIEDLKAEHEDLVAQVRLMCGYLVNNGTGDTKSDAEAALVDIEEAEKEVDTKVRERERERETDRQTDR